MSETITKVCETCNGHPQKPAPFQMFSCADCSGTGRVPDVEATLRAEVARLEKELDTERAWHQSTKLSLSEECKSRKEWQRMVNWDHVGLVQDAERHANHAQDMERRVTKALKQVEEENAELRGEVARLTAELADANFARATMMGGCDSLTNQLVAAKAENTRLTAEVERLEGRNDASRPLAIGDVITLDGEVGMVAWVGSERCRVVWSTEATTSEPNGTAITARAAWLAGCKP